MPSRLVPIALALAPFVAACGGAGTGAGTAATASRDATPGGVAERFMTAVQYGDRAAFRPLVTEHAYEAMFSDGGFEPNAGRVESFEVLGETVDGDRASVAVRVVEGGETQETDLLMRRIEDDWRVSGMRLEMDGQEITVDFEELSELFAQVGEEMSRAMRASFEEAQHTWEQGGTEEEIAAERAAFEALGAVAMDEHRAAWRVDVDGAGRPASAVLAALLADTGIELAAGSQERLSRPVDLTLTGVSRIEAVERVAASVGMHPIWPTPSYTPTPETGAAPLELTLTVGPRPTPAAFAGPFLIEAASLEEYAPHSVGTVEIAARALDLHPRVLAFQDQSSEVLRVDRLRSADGAALADETMMHWSTPTVHGGYFTYSLEKELSGLLRGVEAIHEIEGEVRLPVPVAVETVAWSHDEEEPRELAVGTLSLDRWGQDSQFTLESEESLEHVQVRLSPRRANGDPLGVHFVSSSGWGTQLSAMLQTPEAPVVIDLDVFTTALDAYAFTLGPIPLERSREQPESLTAFEFAGAAPVTAEVLSHSEENGMHSVRLRLENRSNKDVVSATVELVQLDAKGIELGTSNQTLTGEYDFELERFGPLVATGATHEATAFGFPPPAGTTELVARVTSVELRDGTVWPTGE